MGVDLHLGRPATAAALLAAVALVAATASPRSAARSADQLPAQAPAGRASLDVDSPVGGSYVSGRTPLSARVRPPHQPVERVTFFADGRVVCVIEQPPFECEWDAGPGIHEHQVRVVAQLPGGKRLVEVVRTAPSEYAEGVDVEAIQVTATVTDQAGRFVKNLRRSAFRVFEDGVRQTVGHFASENVPLELVTAVDVSGSMTIAMPQVKASVAKFVRALRPEDRVTVLAFNDSTFTIARPTVDLAARLRAIEGLEPWGGTSLYEVVIKALEMQGRKTGRRAVVIFTDGEDRNSRVAFEAAERRLETSDSLLYSVGLGQGVRVPALRQILEKFARASGGRAFFADAAEQLDEPFSQIVDELSNQYLLGYQPKNDRKDGTWRAIRVEVDNPEYRVRHREGYRAERPGATR